MIEQLSHLDASVACQWCGSRHSHGVTLSLYETGIYCSDDCMVTARARGWDPLFAPKPPRLPLLDFPAYWVYQSGQRGRPIYAWGPVSSASEARDLSWKIRPVIPGDIHDLHVAGTGDLLFLARRRGQFRSLTGYAPPQFGTPAYTFYLDPYQVRELRTFVEPREWNYVVRGPLQRLGHIAPVQPKSPTVLVITKRGRAALAQFDREGI